MIGRLRAVIRSDVLTATLEHGGGDRERVRQGLPVSTAREHLTDGLSAHDTAALFSHVASQSRGIVDD